MEQLMDVEVTPAHAEPPRPYQLGSIVHPAARTAEQEARTSKDPVAPDSDALNALFPVKDIHHPDEWLTSPRQENSAQRAVPESAQSPANCQDLIPIEKGNAPQNHPLPASRSEP